LCLSILSAYADELKVSEAKKSVQAKCLNEKCLQTQRYGKIKIKLLTLKIFL